MGRVTKRLLIAVVLFQICSIVAFAGYQEFLLRTGTQVTIQTVPVDPRDLFRGDYVDLRYDISTLRIAGDGTQVIGDLCCISSSVSPGDQVMVGLVQEPGQEFATISSLGMAQSTVEVGSSTHYVNRLEETVDNDGQSQLENRVTIRGTIEEIQQVSSHVDYRIDYGIESFFIPEGRGHEIETADDVKVVISVNKNGRAVIRTLIVDGIAWDPH